MRSALDLVAPELDAQGIAERRVHVDEAAAHGVLAAAAHLLDALVARAASRATTSSKGTSAPGRELERPRLQLERQEALEQGDGLGDDDAAGGERGERLLALADHVRRRRHVGAVEHAARRQHGHVAVEKERQVGGQLGGGLAVGRDDEPAVAPRPPRWRRPARTARRSSARRRPRRGAAAARPPRTPRWCSRYSRNTSACLRPAAGLRPVAGHAERPVRIVRHPSRCPARRRRGSAHCTPRGGAANRAASAHVQVVRRAVRLARCRPGPARDREAVRRRPRGVQRKAWRGGRWSSPRWP